LPEVGHGPALDITIVPSLANHASDEGRQ
jgi:hypothetical protein